MSAEPKPYEIRADFSHETIVVYQAYREEIAQAALDAGKFVSPFSLNRMTWIKPSFLWMMERSNWGQKSGQEYILRIYIKRTSWESALSEAVLTHPEKNIYGNADEWRQLFDAARVIVQWDPERSIRGNKLQYSSIQVGISRHLIGQYVDDWIVKIDDCTPLVKKMRTLLKQGEADKAARYLPNERVYPLPPEIGVRLGMNP